jgi:thiamine kinase-like enzyme
LGITLTAGEENFKKYEIKESITNTFMETADIHYRKYIVRINGKLWPPFTRENEEYNLIKLRDNNIFTSVLINNVQAGFQICHFVENRFSEAPPYGKTESFIKKIGTTLKKIHDVKDFKITYPISQTIHSSFQKYSGEITQKLNPYYTRIKPIIQIIEEDSINFVSSHNDLLPSSVCHDNKNIYFIDWEYSGKNHRSYDLSLLSITSSFDAFQEAALLAGYDPKHQFNIRYYTTLMKAVVSFLLYQWNISKNLNEKSFELEKKLNANIQEAYLTQTFRQRLFYPKLSFFKCTSDYDEKNKNQNTHSCFNSNNRLAKL